MKPDRVSQQENITPEQAQAHLLTYEYELTTIERQALKTIAEQEEHKC